MVEDDVNDDGTFDLVDSSGDTSDNSVTENTYENSDTPDGADDNADAKVTPAAQTRDLTISAY